MVASVTNLGRSGLYDWVVQRTSAVVLALYTLFLVGFLVASPDLQFAQWQGLFAQTWMKVFSMAALISICAHAWVGMWTISTDYLKNTGVRFLFQLVCVGFLFVYLVWGIDILWSV
ncbi:MULTISPECIES: succinate dehydrogenase, hydrophobic membrane anchor protein [unclassified Oceanobacter]|jgi:succinate dehydrogenase / fumarate reductase membrane anchor subunit|uniref:succinate dehydrogenase, hydrophobic membrane anchor protein n=1 Tax=unclassified Oceanobacter TaxID=2620260 RepID=UPI0026E2B13E|nr:MULTISPECIES: succinate dehydrogenase, hydrophobic membrane anchor protein [unclassified Oceanobacter]MDO6683443.1 succinate dehydrogenase, hydrophobic membrane anchor protein [Oceanobacter sp. 5_MG-2023]MDP2507085.1 succinate dehydrogenase, hydrophobic membrane anchor protein [Oceanobacter sp. 3_MG-2023]MDP2548843.1 succinate dehydrogenase, hydrophobic membrane anchor protein [Oceanobacter sp. 4_MG-2023]MDP2609606.1 succinate dehydrogenase, hydrophobic membrane anchor protein [Oceanobacter 